MELNETVRVERPPQDVFDAWVRIDRATRHSPAVVERTKLTEGPIGKGMRFRAVDRWPGMDVGYTVEVTVFDRPERIAAIWSDPLSGGWDAIFEERGGARRCASMPRSIPPGSTVWRSGCRGRGTDVRYARS